MSIFDVIMHAEHGTTYNSYLVRGSEKIALIEGNKAKFTDTFFDTLTQAVDPAEIDYIVLNHMEPDHSGALGALLDAAPKAKVVLTRPGKIFAENISNRELDAIVVSDGQTLELGDKTLRFFIAPFLHWPDTMFTYLEEDGILFPCDFLGAHFCDERMFNDLVENYDYAFKYYFSVIMRPFKEHVRTGLEKIKDLELNVICPSHGPILRSEIPSYLDRYREWSAEPPPSKKKKLRVFYASSYGNTEKMATAIAHGAQEAGADVSVFDLAGGIDMHMVVDEIEAADGIAVGSCTINSDALAHVWTLLSSLATIKIKKKLGCAFGSFGWSGEGPKMLSERLKSLQFRVPEEPMRVKLVPTEEDLRACAEYGARMAEAL